MVQPSALSWVMSPFQAAYSTKFSIDAVCGHWIKVEGLAEWPGPWGYEIKKRRPAGEPPKADRGE